MALPLFDTTPRSADRIVAGLFLAPLVALPANLVLMVLKYRRLVADAAQSASESAGPRPADPLSFVVLHTGAASLGTGALGFLSLLVIWLPGYKLLRVGQALTPFTIAFLSVLASIPAILIIDAVQHGPPAVVLTLLVAVAIGFTFLSISGLPIRSHQPARAT